MRALAVLALFVVACGSSERPCATSLMCGSDCCKAGEVCLGGKTCCLVPCGDTCCAAGSFCLTQGAKQRCIKACNDSGQCPKDAPCCGLFPGGSGCVVKDTSDLQCRCSTSQQCLSGCCAPSVDQSGNPGAYVCKDSTEFYKPYTCCPPIMKMDCPAMHCCVTDAGGNQFCARSCADTSECGATGRCTSFTPSGTCAAKSFCGPTA